MKRTPLKRKTALKRGTKRLASRSKSKRRVGEALSKEFRAWVRDSLRCAVSSCRAANPEPHHVGRIGAGGTTRPYEKDERNVIPLCADHHRLGAKAAHRYGTHAEFLMQHRLWIDENRVWESWLKVHELRRNTM